MLTAVVCCVALAAWYLMRPPADGPQVRSALLCVTSDFRKVIVLMDGAEALGDAGLQARCRATGPRIFFDKQQAIGQVGQRLLQGPDRVEVGRQILRYVTGAELRDADRLAFLDLLDELAELQPGEAPLKALDELRSIQTVYREEVNRIFSQFGTRGGEEVRREKWETYLGFLRGTTTRDAGAEFAPGFAGKDDRGQADRTAEAAAEHSGGNGEPEADGEAFVARGSCGEEADAGSRLRPRPVRAPALSGEKI